MTQGNAMRSTLELLWELSGKGHPFLTQLLSVEPRMVPSATTTDSLPETKAITRESTVWSRDRFPMRLFQHLEPAVPEAFPETCSWMFQFGRTMHLDFC